VIENKLLVEKRENSLSASSARCTRTYIHQRCLEWN